MYKTRSRINTFCIFLAVVMSGSVQAANEGLPVGTIEQIDPGRTGEELEQQQNPSPTILSPDSIKINIPKNDVEIDQRVKIKFRLEGVVIEGNTVFSDEELTKLYRNKLSTVVSFMEMQNFAREIAAHYRNAGYILTRVILPPQEIDTKGIVKFQVIEGFIDQVIVEGNITPATRKLLCAYGKNIVSRKPLNTKTLERYALFASDVPGVSIKTVLQPSRDTVGASEIIFAVEQNRTSWFVSANNFNSELLGREQIIAQISSNGMLQGSQTNLLGIMSFNPKHLKYAALQHRQQLNADGLGLLASISNTVTHPDYSSLLLNYLNTPGQAFIATVNGVYQSIRSRSRNLIFGGGFKYMNSHTAFSGYNLFYDAIRSINLNVEYNFLDKMLGSNSIEFTISQGLNILAARAAPPSIPGGKTDFSKINLSVSRYQALPLKNTFMLLWIKGQYAFTQLLSAEKFGFGGSPFGYGYDPSTLTGDRGYALKFELQYNYFMNKYTIPKIQFFGFADNATIWNINTQIQPGEQFATSMGVGLRMKAIRKLYIEFIVAQPFNTFATNDNNKKYTRFLFNLMYQGGHIFKR